MGTATGYDVVIVGGGAAGCAFAGTLSKKGDRSMLMLEAGPDIRRDTSASRARRSIICLPLVVNRIGENQPMPRSYRLGQRAGAKADTRARIVAAALAIFRDRGLAGASNLAIARAADLAPGTVRNHFPNEGDLSRAVFEALLAELRIPTDAIFDDVDGLRGRVERLARELAAFYERSEPWWRAYDREPDLIRARGGGVDQYYADIDRLMRVALGDLASDERSVAVVASVIGPPTFFALRARGLSFDEAVGLTLELTLPWLERRRFDVTTAPTGDGVANGATNRRPRRGPAG